MPYFEQVDAAIWPRFQAVLELNVASVRAADAQHLGKPEAVPHYVVRRYAEFSAALLNLNTGRGFDVLNTGLPILREEVENFILRMAAEFTERKDQLVFLINNHDMILSVYREHAPTAPETATMEKYIKDRIREFVEEELRPAFGGIMAFVRDMEVQLDRTADPDQIPLDQRRVQGLIRAFAKDWKRAIEAMDEDVMRSFSSFKVGAVVLREVLEQLVTYYERFLNLLRLSPLSRRLGGLTDLIDRHHIIVEVKKHKPNF